MNNIRKAFATQIENLSGSQTLLCQLTHEEGSGQMTYPSAYLSTAFYC